MAPFTPLISTVLPAPTRPCHWKSSAASGPPSSNAAAAMAAAQAIRVLMRPPWSLEMPAGGGGLEPEAKRPRVVAPMPAPVDVERAMDTARHAVLEIGRASCRERVEI